MSHEKITAIILESEYDSKKHKSAHAMENVLTTLQETMHIVREIVEFKKSDDHPKKGEVVFPSTKYIM